MTDSCPWQHDRRPQLRSTWTATDAGDRIALVASITVASFIQRHTGVRAPSSPNTALRGSSPCLATTQSSWCVCDVHSIFWWAAGAALVACRCVVRWPLLGVVVRSGIGAGHSRPLWTLSVRVCRGLNLSLWWLHAVRVWAWRRSCRFVLLCRRVLGARGCLPAV